MAAGGNMGSLWFDLDIKSKIDQKLQDYTKKLNSFDKGIKTLQESINKASGELDKLAKGSDAWNKQKEAIAGMFRQVETLINQTRIYESALDRVQTISAKVNSGGVINNRSITSKLDTKPLEDQISKYERIETLLTRLGELQAKKPSNVMDFVWSDRAGNKDMAAYQAAMETYRKQISDISSELKSLGGENLNLGQVRTQLDSLYNTLFRFDEANRRATSSTRDSREEEQRRARAMKDARIAFEPLVAAQAREEAQERANRANIEATNQARQRQVQVLREQAEALMRNRLAQLQEQRNSLGRLYGQGKAAGLDSAELDTIRQRYREISNEVLNLQTLLQNTKGLSYNDMFGIGRVVGPGANYVKEASTSVSSLKQRTQEAAYAARDLASAFDRVHSSASRSSQVLSDIKSLFMQGGIVFAAQQFADSIIKTGGDIVQQHVALRSILGDVEKADQLFSQTQQLALQSPFTFQELNRDVKQLTAFGVDTDRLYDTTKRLADVASGLGVSFERLGLAYGQVKARSWLDGKELRQFAYAGLPMLQKIADLYNQTGKNGKRDYTTSDIRDMITKRQVSFEDVDKVFQRLTDAGGQFYNMQFVLSNTLLGRWNKLQDAWTIMLGKFADGGNIIGKTFMGAINLTTELVQNIDKLGPVLAAAFSGFALKKVGGFIAGGLASSVLSAKNNLATEYTRAAMAGEQLSAAQLRIIATKREITAEDLKALANAKAITATDLQRAYIMGRITTEQYKQIAPLLGIRTHTATIKRQWQELQWTVRNTFRTKVQPIFTAQYWQNFGGRVGTALGMVGKGIVGIGRSMWAMIGGLPGAIFTALTMLGTKLWQDHSELQSGIEQATNLVQQKHQDLQQYLEDNPLRLNVDTGDLAKQIDQEKEELKEKAGSLYDTIMLNSKSNVKVGDVSPGGDEANQLKYLRRYTELLDEAQTKAQSLQPWFANLIDDANGAFTESVATNLKDLENASNDLQVVLPKLNMKDLVADAKAIKADDENNIGEGYKKIADYILEANKNGKSLTETLAGIRELVPKGGWDEASDFLPKYVNKNGENTGTTFTPLGGFVKSVFNVQEYSGDLDSQIQEVANGMADQFKNLATDPMEQAIYSTLKDAWKSANQLDVIQGNYFDMKLDKAMGLQDFPSLAEDVAKDAASRMSDSTKEELASGQPLTESAKTDMQRAKNEAMNNLRSTWPGTADEIQAILNSKRFDINVWMHIQGDNSAAQSVLDGYYQGTPNKAYSANARGFYSQWSQGSNNVADVEKKARASVDSALEVLNSAKRQKKGIDDATKNYNNAVSAFAEVIGYSYTGSDSGTTKKINAQNKSRQQAADKAQRARERAAEKARREAERREREYMRARQKESQSIQTYYDTWDKWRDVVGDDAARVKVANDKRFSDTFRKQYADPEKLSENYEKLAKSIALTSDERRQFVQELNAKAADKEAQKELEEAQRLNNVFKEQLDNLSKRYEMYEKLSKVAGREIAGNFLFNDNLHSQSYYQYLKEQIQKRFDTSTLSTENTHEGSLTGTFKEGYNLPEQVIMGAVRKLDLNKLGPGITLDEAISKPYEEVKKAFGETIADLFKVAKETRDKLDSEIVDSLSQGFEYFEDYGAQIDDINQKYDEQIARLQERNKLEKDNANYVSDKQLQTSTTVINQQRNREIASTQLKQFQNSSVYTRFFNATMLLSTRGASTFARIIKDNLTKAFESGAMTADEYSQKLKEVDDRMKDINDKHSEAFDYVFDGGVDTIIKRRHDKGEAKESAADKDYSDAFKKYQQAEANGDEQGMADAQSAMDSAKAAKAAGEDMVQGADNAAQTMAIIDKVVHGINDNVQSMKALFDDIADTIEAFGGSEKAEDFKNSGAYAFVSGFSNASQGATDAWESFKSGNVMGVVEGGYRSIIGWATPWAKRHDAKLEKQIKSLERLNKTLENVYSSIERNLNATLGSVYAYLSKDKDAQAIKDGIREYNKANGSWLAKWVKARSGQNINFSRYSTTTYSQMMQADKSGSAYDQELASYMMQRDNLESQLDKERDKKGKDKDKIQDYQNQLDELDDKISTFAKDMANSLYGIDVSSWAKSLSDSIIDAWSSGTDAAEAYHDKVTELMKDLAKNVIAKKYMEIALQPVENLIEQRMKDKSGKLDENDITDIADMLANLESTSVDTITSLLEKLKGKGLDLADVNSSSMSSSIKGLTEQTGDLLAAYANAMRADLSVVRELQTVYLPKLDGISVTTEAQLQQLNMIAANTLRNAEAAEKIQVAVTELNDNINRAQNQMKPIYVIPI